MSESVVYPSTQLATVQSALHDAQRAGLLVPVNNPPDYSCFAFKGTPDGSISKKWNAIGYLKHKKNRLSVVTVDPLILDRLIKRDYHSLTPSPGKSVLSIDDSGTGFPLGGVLVGVSNGKTVKTGTVKTEFFHHPAHVEQRYLEEYTRVGLEVFESFNPTPATHRVEICTGHINTHIRETIRKLGYEVRVTEIKGQLQSQLEVQHAEYIRELTSETLYFDPKEAQAQTLGTLYHYALNWGIHHNKSLLKSGWGALSQYRE